jgi:hypothetical protein
MIVAQSNVSLPLLVAATLIAFAFAAGIPWAISYLESLTIGTSILVGGLFFIDVFTVLEEPDQAFWVCAVFPVFCSLAMFLTQNLKFSIVLLHIVFFIQLRMIKYFTANLRTVIGPDINTETTDFLDGVEMKNMVSFYIIDTFTILFIWLSDKSRKWMMDTICDLMEKASSSK